ncbi:MAG: DMT family transporter [Paracoccaceae bacterium]
MENLRGMVLMTIAMFMFAIADALIKVTSTALPIGEIMIFMGLGGTTIFGGVSARRGDRFFTKAMLDRSIILRSLGEIVGTIGMFTALALIPFSTTAAITQAVPLVITMGAALFLGETVGWPRWSAIIVGFIGVLLIIRPGLDEFDPNSVFALIAVFGLSVRDLATRSAPRLISTPVLSTLGFIVMIPTGAGLLLFSGDAKVPDVTQIALLSGIVVMVSIGYGSITAAMRMGDVSAITPLRYSRIVFAMIIGLVLFSEKMDAIGLIGTAIVISSGLFTIYREHRARKLA